MSIVEWRVEFDAEVEFSNGGSLRVEAFRLDIPSSDISDAALGELFVGVSRPADGGRGDDQQQAAAAGAA